MADVRVDVRVSERCLQTIAADPAAFVQSRHATGRRGARGNAHLLPEAPVEDHRDYGRIIAPRFHGLGI